MNAATQSRLIALRCLIRNGEQIVAHLHTWLCDTASGSTEAQEVGRRLGDAVTRLRTYTDELQRLSLSSPCQNQLHRQQLPNS
jgi:superfamily II helicase